MKTKTLTYILLSFVLASCSFMELKPVPAKTKLGNRFKTVEIIYASAFNNLSASIARNIKDICDAGLPPELSDKGVFLVTHNTFRNSTEYGVETSPYVIRLYSDWNGKAVYDTLKTLPLGARLVDKAVMIEALEFIKDNYSADKYGIVLTSHGTGWLPERYYDEYKGSDSGFIMDAVHFGAPRQLSPIETLTPGEGIPSFKTFGCEASLVGNRPVSNEMDIKDLAKAFPMHFDHIVFDACLMGGIEVAYELKDCADYIAFSQTEVLSTGFCYPTFVQRLLIEENLQGWLEDYFNMYDKYSSDSYWKSATISLVDCSKLDGLSRICNRLFAKYEDEIALVDAAKVQRYFRGDHPWFYDLRDILLWSGVSSDDLLKLDEELKKTVIYKAATPRFYSDINITAFSGLSMYLPSKGEASLSEYYTNLAWNKASLLIYK